MFAEPGGRGGSLQRAWADGGAAARQALGGDARGAAGGSGARLRRRIRGWSWADAVARRAVWRCCSAWLRVVLFGWGRGAAADDSANQQSAGPAPRSEPLDFVASARRFCHHITSKKSCPGSSPPPRPPSPRRSQHPPAPFLIAVTPLTCPLAPTLIAHDSPNGIDGGQRPEVVGARPRPLLRCLPPGQDLLQGQDRRHQPRVPAERGHHQEGQGGVPQEDLAARPRLRTDH